MESLSSFTCIRTQLRQQRQGRARYIVMHNFRSSSSLLYAANKFALATGSLRPRSSVLAFSVLQLLPFAHHLFRVRAVTRRWKALPRNVHAPAWLQYMYTLHIYNTIDLNLTLLWRIFRVFLATFPPRILPIGARGKRVSVFEQRNTFRHHRFHRGEQAKCRYVV